MKILFSGDSITLGQQGVSYVKKVAAEIPDAKITNIACNGETLNMVSRRLLRHLRKHPDYDVIVLAGGLGDVAFRILKQRGLLFRFAYFAQECLGMRQEPDPASFQMAYRKLVEFVKTLSRARLVVLTLNCVSEIPDFPLNRLRQKFNENIRELAAEQNLILADAGQAVDDYLQNHPSESSYFLGNFWKLTYTDKLFALFGDGFDRLSRQRKLAVTFDGLHLNSIGAELFSGSVLKALRGNKLI